MKPNLRKFALMSHITLSVGWFGAVAGFLAVAIAVLTNTDTQLMRGLCFAMWVTGSYVIVPLCFTSLLTGIIMSLGTSWGLFRHYWIVAKFLLTVVSTLILLGFMRTLNYINVLASDTTTSIHEIHNLSQSPVLHSSGGLVVLLVITLLSVYKPMGMTPYGRRQQQSEVAGGLVANSARLRWVLGGSMLTIVLVLMFLVMHLISGGGMRSH